MGASVEKGIVRILLPCLIFVVLSVVIVTEERERKLRLAWWLLNLCIIYEIVDKLCCRSSSFPACFPLV